jgi:hypothetical protein
VEPESGDESEVEYHDPHVYCVKAIADMQSQLERWSRLSRAKMASITEVESAAAGMHADFRRLTQSCEASERRVLSRLHPLLSRLHPLLSRLFMPLFMLPLYLLSLQLILLPQRQKVRLSVYLTRTSSRQF